MKKHLFVLAAAIAFASMANAQFYGNVATGRGGQMSIYGGIASITAKPQFNYWSVELHLLCDGKG